MRIAVVGSGIAGLSAAWLLSRRHDVVLYEKEPRLGGHSNTVEVRTADGPVAVDTGFIVYNTQSYPNLIALFDHLGAPTAPTVMSFAVSLDAGRYEYSGTGAHGLFGQPANLFRPAHWRMASDVLRFFREAPALTEVDGATTLGDWLGERGYSRAFVERHLLPMGAAIWSTPAREMMEFPAAAFARFFANHGLLQVRNRPQWRTVRGGSREYVRRLIDAGGFRVESGDGVSRVARDASGCVVETSAGREARYDHVVLACHADESLRLLGDADGKETRILGAFRYARNETILHGDTALMPKRRRLWSSWNYIGAERGGALCVSYWMNRLQPLATSEDLFVTLNPVRAVSEDMVRRRFVYHHPMLDGSAMRAQRELWTLQGRRRTWFAGSYFGYGFHEDALQSGLAVAEELGGVARPWDLPAGVASGRIHRLPRTAGPVAAGVS